MNRKILTITSLGHFLDHAVTLIFPAVLIIVRDEFKVSLVELGELGTIQFLFFSAASYPAGWLSDRYGSRFVLNLYFTGLILSTILLTFSESYFMIAIGMGCVGFFAGLYHPAGLKLISNTDSVPKYMAYHGIAGSVGLTAGPLIGAGVSVLAGWRWAYLVMGCIAVIGLIINSIFIAHDENHQKPKNHFPTLTTTHFAIFLIGALWGFTHQGLFHFLPLYFSESVMWNIDAVLKGGVLTALVLVVGAVGQIIGGRIGENHPRKNLLIWVVGLNIPFLLLMGYMSNWVLVWIVVILGAINFSFQPVNNSLISDITPKIQKGMVFGISNGLGFGVGSLAGVGGGYIGEYLSLNLIFPVLGSILIPAVFLCNYVRKNAEIL